MSTVLYSNFLNDPQEYTRAESFWKQRWEDLLSEAGQQGDWRTPWFNTTSVNGTPFRDGNPIFSAICPSRRLGVQVIQQDPTEGDLEFSAWIDTFAKGEPEEIQKLVIDCVLSEDTIRRAFDLMRLWIDPDRNGLAELYAILGERFDSGHADSAERHNEHQP